MRLLQFDDGKKLIGGTKGKGKTSKAAGKYKYDY